MSDASKRAMENRLRRQAKHTRRKLLRRIALIAVPAVVLTGLLAVGLTWLFPKLSSGKAPEPTVTGPETVIELAFAGDLNITDKVVSAGATGSGYNYTECLKDVMPLLADADQTVMNFEGNLCGPPYGTQTTSAPPELLDALSAAGVDLLQVANSCTINNGLLGLADTLNGIRSAGMEPFGAYASTEEFKQTRGFVLREIQGVKVAFVAFTKGMNNIALPAGQEDCVNLLYTDYTSTYQKVDTEGITALLRTVAAEEPDVTIALLHWGSEYNTQVSKSQSKIVKLMKSEGVDAIIGTHSHNFQQVDFDEENGTLVAYSLGDFWGDADRSTAAYSAILTLQIAKNDLTGDTRIAGFQCDPIYTYNVETQNGTATQLLRIKPALADYEANGVNAVSEDVYKAMKNADSRIEKLITPKEED
jgi:poly-gamma-glutamate synthesis protein (capsule biosynthesis protein)